MSTGEPESEQLAFVEEVVVKARDVAELLRRNFWAVDNPSRFPCLIRCEHGGGAVNEMPIKLDPSRLLEVAAALKHGQVIPWTMARKFWAAKPISNVALFGLLVSTWPAFLDVSAFDVPIFPVCPAQTSIVHEHSSVCFLTECFPIPIPQEFVNDLDPSIKGRLLEVGLRVKKDCDCASHFTLLRCSLRVCGVPPFM